MKPITYRLRDVLPPRAADSRRLPCRQLQWCCRQPPPALQTTSVVFSGAADSRHLPCRRLPWCSVVQQAAAACPEDNFSGVQWCSRQPPPALQMTLVAQERSVASDKGAENAKTQHQAHNQSQGSRGLHLRSGAEPPPSLVIVTFYITLHTALLVIFLHIRMCTDTSYHLYFM